MLHKLNVPIKGKKKKRALDGKHRLEQDRVQTEEKETLQMFSKEGNTLDKFA